ncbi:hypothetical protein X975_00847, partial [Stegodyphus mimosarum]
MYCSANVLDQTDGLLDVVSLFITCGVDNYKRCFSHLKKETTRWFFEEASKCNLGKATTYDDLVEIGCSVPQEDFFECCMLMDRKIRNRTIAASKNLMKYDEFMGLDASRSCYIPNLSICLDDPDECF